MQISVLPVSTPNRPGPTGAGSSDVLGFEDVLNDLSTDNPRPDGAGSAVPGATDSLPDKTETLAKDRGDTPSDLATLSASAPAPTVEINLPQPDLMAGSQTLLRADHTPDEKTADLLTGSKAAMTDPRTSRAGGLVLADPPSPSDITPTPALADAPPGRQSALPDATRMGMPGDGAIDSPPKMLPALPPIQPAPTQEAQPVLSPDTLTDAASAKSPETPLKGQGDPAPAAPQLGPSSGLPQGPEKSQAKPVSGGAEVPTAPQNADPLSADQTVPRTDPKGAISAGQPSLTAAIQMLTRDDVVIARGIEAAPNHIASIAKLLRSSYSDERVTISTPPAKSAFTDAVALATGQPVTQPAVVTVPIRPTDAEPLLQPTTPTIASAPEAPQADASAPKPSVAPPVVMDMGVEALRSLPTFDLPPLSSQTGGASSVASAPHLPASVTPQALGQTIVQVLQKGDDRQIDLALRPEELGRLRFEMTTSGDKVHIVLFIERPEALDLIRRHADHLLNDLRQAGFSQSSLSFGDWSQREQTGGGAAANIGPTDGPADTLVTVPPARFSPVTALGRLDIRL